MNKLLIIFFFLSTQLIAQISINKLTNSTLIAKDLLSKHFKTEKGTLEVPFFINKLE